jgi:nitrogen fixation/metabolism regulation signal transduction histidine kinase
MDLRALKDRLGRIVTLVAAVGGVGGLLLLAVSLENSDAFSRQLLTILIGIAIAVLALGWLLARKLIQLRRDYQQHVPGSRLTVRTVAVFGTLVVVPLLVVYLFTLEYLNRGIDSWFDVDIQQGLRQALVLTGDAQRLRNRGLVDSTEALARQLSYLPPEDWPQRLERERRALDVDSIAVHEFGGRVLAISNSELLLSPLAPQPPREVLLQIASGRNYITPLSGESGSRTVIAAAPIVALPTVRGGAPARRFVLVRYQVPEALAEQAVAVQNAYSQYGNLADQRQPLKFSFTLALTLVLLLTLLAGVYGAIFFAQRLARPVQDLIAGTRAVGKGDFDTRLALPSRDEMGFLVHAFNDMTKRLRRLNDEAAASRLEVEQERERLAVILSRLSSGVLVIDSGQRLLSANPAAIAILGAEIKPLVGEVIRAPERASDLARAFTASLAERLAAGEREWREQLDLKSDSGNCTLLWTCTPLPEQHQDGNLVVVFDDITVLLTAQRNAAWGEVARRLAHEIKNPLTPIQLSAERLRRKLAGELDAENAQLLDRATHTIVQQVDAMQQMVNAFSEYARQPEMKLARFNLHQLLNEVVELYRLQDTGLEFRLELAPTLGEIDADRGRIRQLLANLVSNAMQAMSGSSARILTINTQLLPASGSEGARWQLVVSDTGPGFAAEVLGRAFEPYITSKARGTGLGLAIVKRIVEEHGGQVEAANGPSGGAQVCVILPLTAERRVEPRRERA